jgi:hypothetical protein
MNAVEAARMTQPLLITKISDLPPPLAAYVASLPLPVGTLAVIMAVARALGRIQPARKPRKPTLASALKQAAKAGNSVKGAEVYQDRVTLQFGEPEPIESGNSWPLDEFRTKETKQ